MNILLASGLLIVIVGLWFGVYWWLNPRLEDPDGEASIVGTCGDTMEIRLKFSGNRVKDTSYSTTGCLYSMNCLVATADLARGKTLEDALDISPETIQESIGGLPTDHMHCATLAVATLKTAIDDYMRKTTGKPSKPSQHTRFSKKRLPTIMGKR